MKTKYRVWALVIFVLIAGALWVTIRTESKWKDKAFEKSPCTLMERKQTAEMNCFDDDQRSNMARDGWILIEDESTKCVATTNGCQLRK